MLRVMKVGENRLALFGRRGCFCRFPLTLDPRTPLPRGEQTPPYLPVANDMARRVAKKIGGWPVSSINEALLDIPSTAHILGGAVIGSDPESAVCDDRHRVFGHANLYVVDGSAVPRNLGVNPAPTITPPAGRAISQVPAKVSGDLVGSAAIG